MDLPGPDFVQSQSNSKPHHNINKYPVSDYLSNLLFTGKKKKIIIPCTFL